MGSKITDIILSALKEKGWKINGTDIYENGPYFSRIYADVPGIPDDMRAYVVEQREKHKADVYIMDSDALISYSDHDITLPPEMSGWCDFELPIVKSKNLEEYKANFESALNRYQKETLRMYTLIQERGSILTRNCTAVLQDKIWLKFAKAIASADDINLYHIDNYDEPTLAVALPEDPAKVFYIEIAENIAGLITVQLYRTHNDHYDFLQLYTLPDIFRRPVDSEIEIVIDNIVCAMKTKLDGCDVNNFWADIIENHLEHTIEEVL